jgi:hypothetical protein
MRTEEVTAGSRISAAARFESLVGVSNAIGTHRNPQDLFGALVKELHRVVRSAEACGQRQPGLLLAQEVS